MIVCCFKRFFSILDKPINNVSAKTHTTEEEMTALIRNVEFMILDCIRKTNKDVIKVITNAGRRNEFIYSK